MSQTGKIMPTVSSVGSAETSLGALLIIPKNISNVNRQSKVMIDKNAYRRKVMILEHCLTLARAYHDQENVKQSDYYSRLATEYFEEILGLVGNS